MPNNLIGSTYASLALYTADLMDHHIGTHGLHGYIGASLPGKLEFTSS